MNEFEFRYVIEQLKRQEEETEKLEKKIDHLTNDMTMMAHLISKMTHKLDKPAQKKRRLVKQTILIENSSRKTRFSLASAPKSCAPPR